MFFMPTFAVVSFFSMLSAVRRSMLKLASARPCRTWVNPRQAPLIGKIGDLGGLAQSLEVASSRGKRQRKGKTGSFCIKHGRFGKFPAAEQRSAELAISWVPETSGVWRPLMGQASRGQMPSGRFCVEIA